MWGISAGPAPPTIAHSGDVGGAGGGGGPRGPPGGAGGGGGRARWAGWLGRLGGPAGRAAAGPASAAALDLARPLLLARAAIGVVGRAGVAGGVQPGQVVLLQLQVGGAEVVLELLQGAGA